MVRPTSFLQEFNDTPDSHLFRKFDSFYNLSYSLFRKGVGTIRYKGKWELIDQFLVSKNLMNLNEPIFCGSEPVTIFNKWYLLESDKEFLGQKPKRSFIGPRYNGGISDHLPIILRIDKM